MKINYCVLRQVGEGYIFAYSIHGASIPSHKNYSSNFHH